MKRAVVIIWLCILFAGIFKIFWYTDVKYSLPTPVPKAYHDISAGTYVELAGKLMTPSNKPVFIHFFNPACPCSRFNIPHFNSLVRRYGSKIFFAVVVLNKEYSAEEIRDKYDFTVPVYADSTIATACGVYSTPQAVLLDAGHNLYYKGNYNKSRYCTNKESNYAQIAIDSLLHSAHQPVFSQYALKAYGCELPVCNKN
jgi:hypothetical protein